MARILSIETSTDVCGAALLEESDLVAETIINRPRVHAERLTAAIEKVLDDGDADLTSVDALAVSAGPGSYTGLRIGVSTVKGLAFARDIPVIGVPSLEVVAAETSARAASGDRICVARDARRDEVYCSIFEVPPADSPDLVTCTRPATVTTYEKLDEVLPTAGGPPVWLTGHARLTAGQHVGADVRIYRPTRPAPTAYWVGRSALRRYETGHFEDLDSFEPLYIRPFHTHERKPLFEGLTGTS